MFTYLCSLFNNAKFIKETKWFKIAVSKLNRTIWGYFFFHFLQIILPWEILFYIFDLKWKKSVVETVVQDLLKVERKDWSKMKMTKDFSKISLIKSSKYNFIFLPAFYLIICPMKAPKNFGKIAILKLWDMFSLGSPKTHFGKIALK